MGRWLRRRLTAVVGAPAALMWQVLQGQADAELRPLVARHPRTALAVAAGGGALAAALLPRAWRVLLLPLAMGELRGLLQRGLHGLLHPDPGPPAPADPTPAPPPAPHTPHGPGEPMH